MSKNKKKIAIFSYNLNAGTYLIGDPQLVSNEISLKNIPKAKKNIQGYNEKDNYFYLKTKNKIFDYIEKNTVYNNISNLIIIKEFNNEKLNRNKSVKEKDFILTNYSKIVLKNNARLIFDFKDENIHIFINSEDESRPLLMLCEF